MTGDETRGEAEVEALTSALGDIRVENARQADWWTSDEDHSLLAQVLRAECAAWAPGVLAAGYLSPDAVAAVTREARAEALCEAREGLLNLAAGYDDECKRGIDIAAIFLRVLYDPANHEAARTAPLQDAEEVGE